MEDGVSAREEEDSDGISSGSMESGSGSMDEDAGVADELNSDEISSFWPTLACSSRD